MASITGWLRLEPLPRTTELETSLQARIADPLWFLSRQWQIGEFAGEDAGSPVAAQLQAQVGRVSRYHAGPATGSDASAASVDIDDGDAPLEVVVEAEPSRSAGDNVRAAAETGLHFGRLLDHHGESAARTTFLADFPIEAADPAVDDPDGAASTRLYRGRVIDGQALQAQLRNHLGAGSELTSLPASISAPATPGVLAAANDFLAWWSRSMYEPADGTAPAWKPSRLEYGFAVSATVPPGTVDGAATEIVLHADEYRDGHLDWYSFRADSGPTLGATSPATSITRTVIPAPVTYRGQPSDRFWGFEDAKVSFGELRSPAGDIGRVLLAEFALRYGNDWFIIPVDLAVGSVAAVQSLTVTDTFGVETVIPATADTGRWRMYSTTDDPALDAVFVLPPTLVQPLTGQPVEEVALFRDEMANMVWGVERRVVGPGGHVIDRYAEHQRSNREAPSLNQVAGGVEDAEIMYRLASNVPRHWLPFVPVPSAAGGSSAIQLERRAMVRYGLDGQSEVVEPRGQILADDDGQPLVLEEEEVPRSGVVVERSHQLVRWTDGSRHLWLGRQVGTGQGEGSSGLRHDFTDQL